MKKLLAVLFAAATLVAGAFAQDASSDFPAGSWVDENWNGEWVISSDGGVQIKDSVTGELYYNFTEDKITGKELKATDEGIIYTFACAETGRVYSFIKGITISADLTLRINPDWSEEDYQTIIKFKAPELPTVDTAEVNAAVNAAVSDANAAIEAATPSITVNATLPSVSVSAE